MIILDEYTDRWCYIISHRKLLDENIFKIGITNNIKKRLSIFNTSTPYPFEVFCLIESNGVMVEHFLHNLFHEQNVAKEFYKLTINDFSKIFKIFGESVIKYPENLVCVKGGEEYMDELIGVQTPADKLNLYGSLDLTQERMNQLLSWKLNELRRQNRRLERQNRKLAKELQRM